MSAFVRDSSQGDMKRAIVLAWFSVRVARCGGQSFQGGLARNGQGSQGVIPGVTVTLTNQETSVARDTVSNSAGEYSFPGVPPGDLHRPRLGRRLQDLRAPGHPHRHAAVPDARHRPRSRRRRGDDHRRRAGAADRNLERVHRRRARQDRRSRRCRRSAAWRFSSATRCRRSPTPAIRT